MALSLRRCAIVLFAGSLILISTHDNAQVAAGEYEIKAAFLGSFAKFVEWPAAALPQGAALIVAVVGDDPFGETLVAAMHGATANGHPLVLRHVAWNEPQLATCHILFISSSELQHLTQIFAEISEASILTVADFDSFARRGGIIELKMIGGRVRFEINSGTATHARLHISSKLLALANKVHELAGAAR